MNYDAEFCEQIRVSEADKRQCLALISKILFLATNARSETPLEVAARLGSVDACWELLRNGLAAVLFPGDGGVKHCATQHSG